MVLEWTPEEASLLPAGLLQRQSTSQEKHERIRTINISLLGALRPGDRRDFTLIYSCIIIPLYETLHDRPFSVTSEESLRDSEPFSYWVPEH